MVKKNFRSLILALVSTGIVAGCATKPAPPPAPPPTPAKAAPPYTWNDSMTKGPPKIVIDVSKQRAYFYRGDTRVGETRCSTGKKGFQTVTGEFTVTQKNRDHLSNLYGSFVDGSGSTVKSDVDTSKMKVPEGCSFKGAKMPYYMRFHNGYGLHAGRVPNYPASHGCVRLPSVMARYFFENSQVGTPVIVHN